MLKFDLICDVSVEFKLRFVRRTHFKCLSDSISVPAADAFNSRPLWWHISGKSDA